MSLERHGGKIVFQCDTCPEVLETDTSDFDDARGELKNHGWLTTKLDAEWRHYCDDCAENME